MGAPKEDVEVCAGIITNNRKDRIQAPCEGIIPLGYEVGYVGPIEVPKTLQNNRLIDGFDSAPGHHSFQGVNRSHGLHLVPAPCVRVVVAPVR